MTGDTNYPPYYPTAFGKDKEIEQEPIQKSQPDNTENNGKHQTTVDFADNKIGYPSKTVRQKQ